MKISKLRTKRSITGPRFADCCLDLTGDSISIEKDGSNWTNYFLCGVKVTFVKGKVLIH